MACSDVCDLNWGDVTVFYKDGFMEEEIAAVCAERMGASVIPFFDTPRVPAGLGGVAYFMNPNHVAQLERAAGDLKNAGNLHAYATVEDFMMAHGFSWGFWADRHVPGSRAYNVSRAVKVLPPDDRMEVFRLEAKSSDVLNALEKRGRALHEGDASVARIHVEHSIRVGDVVFVNLGAGINVNLTHATVWSTLPDVRLSIIYYMRVVDGEMKHRWSVRGNADDEAKVLRTLEADLGCRKYGGSIDTFFYPDKRVHYQGGGTGLDFVQVLHQVQAS